MKIQDALGAFYSGGEVEPGFQIASAGGKRAAGNRPRSPAVTPAIGVSTEGVDVMGETVRGTGSLHRLRVSTPKS